MRLHTHKGGISPEHINLAVMIVLPFVILLNDQSYVHQHTNAPIGNTAVSGMPDSQAGVAAAIASTSRQVGAAIGIAVSGTVLAMSRARGTDFTRATHPIWWIMTGCGAIVLLLGWASATAWARESADLAAPELTVAG